MPESYTVQLLFRSEEVSGRDLLADVAGDILAWVTRGEIELSEPFPHYGSWRMPTLGDFTVDGGEVGRSEWWRTVWSRPDSQGRPIDWVTSARLATLGDDVECGLQIRVNAREGFITGDFASVDPPRIVPQLVEKPALSATCMGEGVTASPNRLTGSRVGRFVSERLEDTGRRLPVVVVSAEEVTGRPSLDPHRLAGQLAGLAEVALLHDGEAAWELTKQVGKEFSCFGGAVRVYWPGFNSRTDDPFSHRLWLPDRVSDRGPGAFAKRLFNFLCSRVGRALGESPVWREVQREIQAKREEGWRNRLEELGADKELTEALLENIQADQREAENERDEALKWVTAVENELKDVARERDQLQKEKEQLRIAYAHSPGQRQGSASPPLIESVFDAVVEAADLPHTEVLDTATDSALRSQSNRGPDLYKVFEALDSLAAQYRLGLGKGAREWLREQLPDVPYEYASDLSDTTTGKREQDYTFGGIFMPKHLKFGGGHNTKNLLRVHFEYEFDDEAPRLVIGHVGEHLPNEMS